MHIVETKNELYKEASVYKQDAWNKDLFKIYF